MPRNTSDWAIGIQYNMLAVKLYLTRQGRSFVYAGISFNLYQYIVIDLQNVGNSLWFTGLFIGAPTAVFVVDLV